MPSLPTMSAGTGYHAAKRGFNERTRVAVVGDGALGWPCCRPSDWELSRSS